MKWIKVEDQYPDCCVDVIFTNGVDISAGWLETYEPLETPSFFDALTRTCYEDVTHWMELPNLPEK